jgi:acyl carrier protein
MAESLESRIIRIIATAKGLEADELTPSSSMEELGLDSLDAMSMIFDLENEFEIEIPDDAAERARTVGDLIEGVRLLVAEKG